MEYEEQSKEIKITPTVKQQFILLQAQFFHDKNASEALKELIRCWYEHNK